MIGGFLNLGIAGVNVYFYTEYGHWWSLLAIVISTVAAAVCFLLDAI